MGRPKNWNECGAAGPAHVEGTKEEEEKA